MKILIVTYTYPPAKSVNGFRPFHFAKALEKGGHDVHVLTRHFTGLESYSEYSKPNFTPFSMSKEENIIIHRTPFENSWFKYYTIPWLRKTNAWKIIYLVQLVCGRCTQESYNKWFKPLLKELLKTKTFQLILVESGPTNLVRIVSNEALRFHVPYIIDFRDVFYHEMLKTGRLPLNKYLKIWFEKEYMQQSINKAIHCIGESKAKLDSIGIESNRSTIIHNGYDEEIWESTEAKESNNFLIVIAGTLYNNSSLDLFLQGIAGFQSNYYSDAKVLFIAPGGIEIITKLESQLLPFNLEILIDRISYKETVTLLKRAKVVAYHGWKDYNGIYSTKIYDYLRSGKKIWIVPSDHDVIADLVQSYADGYVQDDPALGAAQLSKWYSQWKAGSLVSALAYDVKNYSRQYQSQKILYVVSSI